MEPPDLVILDISIPPPDGVEVCRRIREGSQVPILTLTVRDATLDKVGALDLGADDYLTKPFDHLELLARLRSLMRRANSASPASVPELTIGDLTLDQAWGWRLRSRSSSYMVGICGSRSTLEPTQPSMPH